MLYETQTLSTLSDVEYYWVRYKTEYMPFHGRWYAQTGEQIKHYAKYNKCQIVGPIKKPQTDER